MKLGIIVSSGGSAFEEIARIAASDGIRFTVITDRPCGAEAIARRVGANHIRIEDQSRTAFSAKVADVARTEGINRLLLFFDRLVSRELYEAVPTDNIHPAALPAFKGLKGVEDAYDARARLLGCSLHTVDATVDGGPLLAQIARGVDPDWAIARWQKMAFLMKVYCGLVWVSRMLSMPSDYVPLNASHGIANHWKQSFLDLQAREGECVVQGETGNGAASSNV